MPKFMSRVAFEAFQDLLLLFPIPSSYTSRVCVYGDRLFYKTRNLRLRQPVGVSDDRKNRSQRFLDFYDFVRKLGACTDLGRRGDGRTSCTYLLHNRLCELPHLVPAGGL